MLCMAWFSYVPRPNCHFCLRPLQICEVVYLKKNASQVHNFRTPCKPTVNAFCISYQEFWNSKHVAQRSKVLVANHDNVMNMLRWWWRCSKLLKASNEKEQSYLCMIWSYNKFVSWFKCSMPILSHNRHEKMHIELIEDLEPQRIRNWKLHVKMDMLLSCMEVTNLHDAWGFTFPVLIYCIIFSFLFH